MTDKDELREHSFDGIQEYDNDLPRWWLWLFAITIIVAIVYPFIYDFGPGEFASETVDSEVAAIKQNNQLAAPAVSTSEQDLLQLVSQTNVINQGKDIYNTRCMPCHGDKGQGMIGPNLTDEYWIHGGKISEVRAIVVNGVLEKGMLAWKDQLTPDQINAVVAFVWSLYGSNPANPKAPEGTKVVR